MKEIPLTRSYITIVDDEDYEELMRHKWCVRWTSRGCYAGRGSKFSDKCSTDTILMHREIMKALPGEQVDHKDRDGLNNQRKNLRICTPTQNQQNRRKQNGCSSRFKGVSWNKEAKRWRAYILRDGIQCHLGYYGNEADAARAYNVAAIKHFGEFALLNVIHD